MKPPTNVIVSGRGSVCGDYKLVTIFDSSLLASGNLRFPLAPGLVDLSQADRRSVFHSRSGRISRWVCLHPAAPDPRSLPGELCTSRRKLGLFWDGHPRASDLRHTLRKRSYWWYLSTILKRTLQRFSWAICEKCHKVLPLDCLLTPLLSSPGTP